MWRIIILKVFHSFAKVEGIFIRRGKMTLVVGQTEDILYYLNDCYL